MKLTALSETSHNMNTDSMYVIVECDKYYKRKEWDAMSKYSRDF